MSTFMHKRFVVLSLLAITLVNPALLAQVAQPAQGSRASQVIARRAFRRSRRIWLLVPAARTQPNRQKAMAGKGPGPTDSTVIEVSPAVPAGGFATLPPAPEGETPRGNRTLAAHPAAPRYLLYCTLLI